MMDQGIFFAVLTGLTWTMAGVIISRCAKENFSLGTYSFLHTFFAGILSFLFFSKISSFTFSGAILTLCILVFSAGVFNASAQFFVRRAMKKGNHAPIWAMMQCCMLFPFFAGIFLFGEKTSFLPASGIFLMICGILLPCIKGFRKVKDYFLPAMTALLLFGLAQILYLVCSSVKTLSDPALLRPGLVCFGNMAAWSILVKLEEKKWQFSKKVFLLAFLMAFVHAGGLFLFFKALDLLTQAGKGNIAVPLIMGANIGGFSLYGLLILRQKNSFVEVCSILAILAGLFLTAFTVQ